MNDTPLAFWRSPFSRNRQLSCKFGNLYQGTRTALVKNSIRKISLKEGSYITLTCKRICTRYFFAKISLRTNLKKLKHRSSMRIYLVTKRWRRSFNFFIIIIFMHFFYNKNAILKRMKNFDEIFLHFLLVSASYSASLQATQWPPKMMQNCFGCASLSVCARVVVE